MPYKCTSAVHGGVFPAQHQLQDTLVRLGLRDKGTQEGRDDVLENSLMTVPVGLPSQTLTFTRTSTEVPKRVPDGRCKVTEF